MAATPQSLKAFTGARTKVVWIQQQQGCDNYMGLTNDFRIVGFDTEVGERIIVPDIGMYAAPLITPGGTRVVYTDNADCSVWCVDWDGANRRRLAQGSGLTVWRDPESGVEWVYTRPNNTKSWVSKSKPIKRFQLDNPGVVEVLWERKSVSSYWFQMAPDGSRAAAVMFWPSCGYLDFTQGAFTKLDKGCWTAMAQDDSRRVWVFQAGHRLVKIYDAAGELLSTVDISGGHGVDGWEIYHPRWSTNPRFLTTSGPYSANRNHPCAPGEWHTYIPEGSANLTKFGGYNVEIHLGRFNAEYTAVEEWLRITDNGKADFFADSWIEREGSPGM